MDSNVILSVKNIDVYYGNVQAVWDVSFDAGDREVVTLIGANGAGKTTILKTLCGLMAPRQGQILFDGEDICGRPPYELVARGLVLIPEARQLWPGMTVRENLEMGAYCRSARAVRSRSLEGVFAALRRIREQGVTVLLVEQNVPHALALADRAYVLETGRVTLAGACVVLARDSRVREQFLGAGSV